MGTMGYFVSFSGDVPCHYLDHDPMHLDLEPDSGKEIRSGRNGHSGETRHISSGISSGESVFQWSLEMA